MGDTHEETNVLLGLVVKGWSDELPREWSKELPKEWSKELPKVWSKELPKVQGVRLKLAIIAKIENVDLSLQVKYLSDRSTCMDQAMYLSRKEREQ